MGIRTTPLTAFRVALLAIGLIAVVAADARSQSLQVLNSKVISDAAGNAVVVGEVQNNTQMELALANATATLNLKTGGTATATGPVRSSFAAKLVLPNVIDTVLPPTATGFFQASPTSPIPFSNVASVASVVAQGQQIALASAAAIKVSGSLSADGSYTLQAVNESLGTVAYNVQVFLAGTLDFTTVEEVDSSLLGTTTSPPCATAAIPPGGKGTITGSFNRPMNRIKQVALRWEETSVSFVAFNAPSAGGVGNLTVSTRCSWTAVSNDAWISIVIDGATVRLSVAANPTTSPRVGTLTVAGLTVSVEQAAGTVSSFTDPTLTSRSSTVRGVHIIELRSRIDALRSRFGLTAPYAWTENPASAGVRIRALHIQQLRDALGQAYAAANRSAPTYTDPTLTAGATTIKAVHITELRSAVIALEQL